MAHPSLQEGGCTQKWVISVPLAVPVTVGDDSIGSNEYQAAALATLWDEVVTRLLFLKHQGVSQLREPLLDGGVVAEVVVHACHVFKEAEQGTQAVNSLKEGAEEIPGSA